MSTILLGSVQILHPQVFPDFGPLPYDNINTYSS